MSRNLTYLAREDRQHFVACTDDGGKVYINWRHARVSLAPTEMLAMTEFLETVVPRLKPGSLLGNSLYCVLQDEEGNFELWVLGVGLYLGPTEFNRFFKLMTAGAQAIRTFADMALMQDAPNVRLN